MQHKARFIIAAIATAITSLALSSAFASDPIKIGLAVASLRTDFFVQIVHSAERAAKGMRATVVIVDAKGDGATQERQVQDLVNQKIQALIFIPAGAQASAVPVRIAKAAGIPVVTIDRNPADAPGDTFIATDQVAAAKALGQYACNRVGGTGDLATIIGPPHTTHEDDRDRGFKQAMEICPGINEADRSWSDWWTTNEGFAVAEKMVARDPDIVLIFGHSDALALGAALAVKKAYVGHKVYVVGFDGDAEGLQAVDDGILDATMTQPTRLMGKMAIQSALALVGGKSPPAMQLQDAVLTTKANVHQLIADHP